MKNNKLVYGWFNGEECFYIGMGSQRRSRSRSSRNPHCARKRKLAEESKTFRVEIFDKELTVDQACKLEIELIKELGRRDINTGRLTNLTDGGEGVSYWKGKKRSQATKDKISESLEGNTSGKGSKRNKGNHHTEETKLKISKRNKGRKRTEETKNKIRKSNTGKRHSQKTREKMSKLKGKPVTTPLGVFSSSKEARESYNVCRQTFLNWLNDERKPEFSRIGYS